METIGNSQLIIRVLLSGESFTSNEISKQIAESEEKTLRPQDISSILSKISNPEKSNLAFLIDRTMKDRAFTYKMKDEALVLSEDQAYGLTLKKGPSCFSLENLKKEFPELAKYIQPGKKSQSPRKRKKTTAKKDKTTVSPSSEALTSDQKPEPPNVTQPRLDTSLDDLEKNTVQKLVNKILTEISKDMDININVKLNIKFDI